MTVDQGDDRLKIFVTNHAVDQARVRFPFFAGMDRDRIINALLAMAYSVDPFYENKAGVQKRVGRYHANPEPVIMVLVPDQYQNADLVMITVLTEELENETRFGVGGELDSQVESVYLVHLFNSLSSHLAICRSKKAADQYVADNRKPDEEYRISQVPVICEEES